MITTAIIDDEKDAIRALTALMKMHFPDIKLIGSYDIPGEAIKALKHDPPDILFLDIDMPGANGFEVLDAIKNENVYCIFATAHEQYAIRAIKANAADYLLKPIDSDELVEAVKKVLNLIDRQQKMDYTSLLSLLKIQSARVHVPTGKGIRFIQCDDIIYLKASGNYTNLYLENGKKLIAIKKIHEFTELLAPYQSFLRVHNSYLVNMEKVHEYFKEGSLILNDETEIPVSRKYKGILKETLGF